MTPLVPEVVSSQVPSIGAGSAPQSVMIEPRVFSSGMSPVVLSLPPSLLEPALESPVLPLPLVSVPLESGDAVVAVASVELSLPVALIVALVVAVVVLLVVGDEPPLVLSSDE